MTLPRGTYLIPNQLLCFAAALAFCWFAFAYALWFVPWAFRSGMWHFGLSIAAVGAFAISSVVSRHVSALDKVDRAFLPTIFAFCVSPLLFLLIQGFYFAEGMHRLWRVLRHASSWTRVRAFSRAQ